MIALGVLVGTAELIARYRDAPIAALQAPPAWIYVAVNAVASVSALALVRVFGWKFGLDSASGEAQRWIQLLVAGVGAMALFRSSLFVVRVGDEDVGVGPSSLLQIILTAADRGVDRSRASPRATAVANIMRDVSFDQAWPALPPTCVALMQNLSVSEQQEIGRAVTVLVAQPMDPRAKSLNLGLLLMNYVGDSVLKAAVNSLGPSIKTSSDKATEKTSTPAIS